ncbi:18865_t:CDS:1, partial [Racocetra fulgida]
SPVRAEQVTKNRRITIEDQSRQVKFGITNKDTTGEIPVAMILPSEIKTVAGEIMVVKYLGIVTPNKDLNKT